MRRVYPFIALALAACARHEPPGPSPGAGGASSGAASGAAPTLVRERAARSFHGFTPSIHGFRFRNGFRGSIVGTGETGYGLCGGMSFAAADYFLADRAISGGTEPPEDGTPLFDYIYMRQAASFGWFGVMGLKFVEWMQLPDRGEDSAFSRTAEELPGIVRALARGEPVVLGLVLTSVAASGKAWDNHQVLAYSVIEPAAGPAQPGRPVVIRVYDPNFPGRDDITVSVEGERIAMQIPGGRSIPVRGVFRMAYTPATPPP